jgi:hypothetical protein
MARKIQEKNKNILKSITCSQKHLIMKEFEKQNTLFDVKKCVLFLIIE